MLDSSPSALDPAATPLPRSLRILCVGADEPSWVSLTMQLSARGCDEPLFRWCSTSQETLTILRHQIFDCLVLATRGDAERETDLQLALQLAEAIRSSGHDEPVFILTDALDDEAWEQFARCDCQVVITRRGWDAASLVPLLTRAVRSLELAREHAQLKSAQQRRLAQDRSETDLLLLQQRNILCTPRLRTEGATLSETQLPEKLRQYYQQLLRTIVMMGAGSLSTEIRTFAQLLIDQGLAASDAFRLHLDEVSALTAGLGFRSARHAVARADLLILELLITLSESRPRSGLES